MDRIADRERLAQIRETRARNALPLDRKDYDWLLDRLDALGQAILPMCGKNWMTFCDFCGEKSQREAVDETNFLRGYRVFIPHKPDCVWLFAHNVYGESER